MIGVLAAAGLMVGCHRKTAAPEERIGPLPVESFRSQWRQTVPLDKLEKKADTVTDLFLREDLLVVYSEGNHVYHLERDSGVRIASFRPVSRDASLRAPILVSDQIVYPANTTLEVYNRLGEKAKTVQLDDNISSDGVGEGHALLIGVDHEGGGRALNIDLASTFSRGISWQLMTRGRISASPALSTGSSKGIAYIASEDGRVYAVLLETRLPFWPEPGTFNTDGRITADLKVDDSGVYVASMDSKLYCLDPLTAKIRWQYFAGVALEAAPVVTTTTVYQHVRGQGLVALDKVSTDPTAYNRKARWVAKNVRQVLAEDEKYVYVAMNDSAIVALEKSSGKERFRAKRSDFNIFATNLKDATIYAATRQGDVVAITPVLKPGGVGQIVMMDVRLLPMVAVAD